MKLPHAMALVLHLVIATLIVATCSAMTSGGTSGDGVVTLSPFGEPEGLVIDPSGGFAAVRFDPPFQAPYVIQFVTFFPHTWIGVPAVFPSIRLCSADAAGRPELLNPILIQSRFVGSSDGTNSLPVDLTVTEAGKTFFVAIEFPLRGTTYPNDYPGLMVDQVDLERGFFSATYNVSPTGSLSVRDFADAAVSMRFHLRSQSDVPIGAPTNLRANRVKDRLVFAFRPPGDARVDGAAPSPHSLAHTEVLWGRDFGPWRLFSRIPPGLSKFETDSIPVGCSRWAVRAVDRAGNRSPVSNIEVVDPYTRILPNVALDSEEPNGTLKEALPVVLPIDRSDDVSIFPCRDRDFYSFTGAHRVS